MFLKRTKRVPHCACSTLEFLASITVIVVASAGSLLSMALSAVVRCPLTALFTWRPEREINIFVSAILKATAKTSPGERCEWESTWVTVQGMEMQTLIQAGTQCPGL